MDYSFDIKNNLFVSKYFNWIVELVGGSVPMLHINKEYSNGEDDQVYVKANSSTNVQTPPPLLTFGRTQVVITVECGGEPVATKTVNGFALFFYIFVY